MCLRDWWDSFKVHKIANSSFYFNITLRIHEQLLKRIKALYLKYGKSINPKASKQPESRIVSPLEIVVESSNSRVNNKVRKIQEKLKRVLQIIYQLSFQQSGHEEPHKNEFWNDKRDVSTPDYFRLGSPASIAAPNIQVKQLGVADIRQIPISLFKSLPREAELVKYIKLIKVYLVERSKVSALF